MFLTPECCFINEMVFEGSLLRSLAPAFDTVQISQDRCWLQSVLVSFSSFIRAGDP